MRETSRLADIEDNFIYKDILYLDRPISLKHPRQDRLTRAAQFSPFAALSGFDDEIKEVERTTSNEIFLSDEEKNDLNNKLNNIKNTKDKYISITYFLKDKKKDGGSFIIKKGYVRRIDIYNNQVIFKDKEKINIKDIIKIDIIDNNNLL